MFNSGNIKFIAFIAIINASSLSDASLIDLDTEPNLQELVKRLDSVAKRRHYGIDPKASDFEILLKKIIKYGGEAEKPLLSKLKQDAALLEKSQIRLKEFDAKSIEDWSEDFWRELSEVDRLSNNLELLTALRRVQKKSDPLSIQVVQPKDLKAIPGKLPTFSVKLKSVDVEKTPVWVQLIPHFHGSHREAQWRFEVKSADGKTLPVRPNTDWFRIGGGIKSDGWLKYGEYLDTILPMGDFIDIPDPGEYTVTLMYHSKLPIADITDAAELNELILFRSDSFKLTVVKGTKRIIESTKGDRKQVLSLIVELPDKGVVKLVGGVYDEDDFAFVPPESPAGKILTLNWHAVPALLDSLSDTNLARHRKAWLLSLLYAITAEHDLNPAFSGALPRFEGMAGKNTLGASLSDDRRIIPGEQDVLIAKWEAYRDRYLDIRESDDK